LAPLATNKIVGISDEAAAHLGGFFYERTASTDLLVRQRGAATAAPGALRREDHHA
jgi:hypothetical protein